MGAFFIADGNIGHSKKLLKPVISDRLIQIRNTIKFHFKPKNPIKGMK
jgi:hypothetical protein